MVRTNFSWNVWRELLAGSGESREERLDYGSIRLADKIKHRQRVMT